MADNIEQLRRSLVANAPFADRGAPIAIDGTALAEIERRLVNRHKFDAGDGRVAVALSSRSNLSKQLQSFTDENAHRMLIEELRRQRSHAWSEPEGQVRQLLNGTSIADLARILGTSDGGWLLATCRLIHEAGNDSIFDVVGTHDDASNLVLAYVMITHVPVPHRRALLERLARSEDAFRNASCIAFAFEWISAAISADQDPDMALFEAIVVAKRPFRNEAIGLLLARLVHWLEDRRFSGKRHRRGVTALLAGVRAIRTSDAIARDIDAVLEAAGSRSACVLAAMSTWLIEPEPLEKKLAAAVRTAGMTTLERLFGSTMRCTDDEAMATFTQLQPLLGPLITGLSRIGMDAAAFNDLYYGLASDRYSRDHRISFWWRDRGRALALIAVAANVARISNSDALMKAACDAATHACSQPAVDIPLMPLDFSELNVGLDFAIPQR